MSEKKEKPEVVYDKATKAIIDRAVGNLSSVLDGRGMKENDYPTANAQCLVMDKRLITDALELIKGMQSSIQQLVGQSTINGARIEMDGMKNIHADGDVGDLVYLCCRVMLMMHDGSYKLPKLPTEVFIFCTMFVAAHDGEMDNLKSKTLLKALEYEKNGKNDE